jgi:hypothetical protein
MIVTKERRPRTGHVSSFWYRVLDVIHHCQLSAPTVIDGCVSIHRRQWIKMFYRVDDTKFETGAQRAWDRFKNTSREVGISRDVSPPVEIEGTFVYAGIRTGYLHIDIKLAYAAAYAKLGAPHPGGELAEIEAEEAAEEAAARAAQPQPQETQPPENDLGRTEDPM